jgi:nucleoside phosphorylase
VLLFAGALAPSAGGAASFTGLCATATKSDDAPYVAIFSAFPAETRPIVAATTVESQVVLGGRPFYIGRLGNVRVVVGLVGIGLVNAEHTAGAVLDGMNVAAVVFSGVAGSTARIAEVVVPDDWVQGDLPAVYPANAAMMAFARRAQRALVSKLEKCALVPPESDSATKRCLGFKPQMIIGGHGSSDDPYGGSAFPCPPGDDLGVLGCGLPEPSKGKVVAPIMAAGIRTATERATTQPDIVDMETAAVARVAAQHGVPFLGIRGVSDGAGDPLGDRGFPAQFFDYYVISADNAGIVTRSVVRQVRALTKRKAGRKACDALAIGDWDGAAALISPSR